MKREDNSFKRVSKLAVDDGSNISRVQSFLATHTASYTHTNPWVWKVVSVSRVWISHRYSLIHTINHTDCKAVSNWVGAEKSKQYCNKSCVCVVHVLTHVYVYDTGSVLARAWWGHFWWIILNVAGMPRDVTEMWNVQGKRFKIWFTKHLQVNANVQFFIHYSCLFSFDKYLCS